MADQLIHDTTTNYITRAEYAAAHSALEARVVKIEADMAVMRSDLSQKIDKLLDKIENLRDDMYKYRTTSLSTALGWAISFIIGSGGLFGLLELLHAFK